MSSNIQTNDDSIASNAAFEVVSDPDSDSVINIESTSDMSFEEISNAIAYIVLDGEFDDPDVVEDAWEMWKQDRSQITEFIDAYRQVCLDGDDNDDE